MGGHDPESGRSVRGKKKFFLLSVDNSSLFTEPTDVRSLLYSQSTPLVQALSDLGNSCVPEYTASVEFYESRNWVNKWSTIYTYIYIYIYIYLFIFIGIYTSESPLEIQTPKRYENPNACVIAQQYSSADCVSLHCHSRKATFGAF